MRGRKAQPPRLWYREDDRCWYILDNREGRRVQISTGLAREQTAAAAEALREYLGSRHEPIKGICDPTALPIADVIAAYEEAKLPKRYEEIKGRIERKEMVTPDERTLVNRHNELVIRLESITAFFGARMVAHIKKSLCLDYVDWCTGTPNERNVGIAKRARAISDQTARRHLEDLRSAINAYHREHVLMTVPMVSLPEKREGRQRWLLRSEAARLLGAALGFKWDNKTRSWQRTANGRLFRADRRVRTVRIPARRFILIGLYSGRREETIRRTLWIATTTHPWFDLDRGIYHGRGRDERETKKRRPPAKIAGRLIPHLKRWYRQDVDQSFYIGREIRFVIHRSGGNQLAGKIRTAWEGIVEDAGLDSEVIRHALRHTAATWLMQLGTDRWQAAGFLGMTVEQLEANYGHHHPDFQEEAAGAFGRQRV